MVYLLSFMLWFATGLVHADGPLPPLNPYDDDLASLVLHPNSPEADNQRIIQALYILEVIKTLDKAESYLMSQVDYLRQVNRNQDLKFRKRKRAEAEEYVNGRRFILASAFRSISRLGRETYHQLANTIVDQYDLDGSARTRDYAITDIRTLLGRQLVGLVKPGDHGVVGGHGRDLQARLLYMLTRKNANVFSPQTYEIAAVLLGVLDDASVVPSLLTQLEELKPKRRKQSLRNMPAVYRALAMYPDHPQVIAEFRRAVTSSEWYALHAVESARELTDHQLILKIVEPHESRHSGSPLYFGLMFKKSRPYMPNFMAEAAFDTVVEIVLKEANYPGLLPIGAKILRSLWKRLNAFSGIPPSRRAWNEKYALAFVMLCDKGYSVAEINQFCRATLTPALLGEAKTIYTERSKLDLNSMRDAALEVLEQLERHAGLYNNQSQALRPTRSNHSNI